jgi:hypothetical protein
MDMVEVIVGVLLLLLGVVIIFCSRERSPSGQFPMHGDQKSSGTSDGNRKFNGSFCVSSL